jgi:energy-coupling factor transporter ATP-binding protein EcfA2
MIELRRLLLIDWYLFRVEQFDIRGMTALIGPNGAGKSAIIDAAQTALTGASMANIRFNASAQSTTKSKRSIRDYCLGVVSLDDKGEHSEPTRQNAYTYAILGLVDMTSREAINIGVAFSASAAKSEERCEARFMVRGGLMDREDLLESVGNGEVETRQWHAVRGLLRTKGFAVEDGYGSASEFVDEVLRAVSPAGFPLDPRRFVKAFRNALMLKPVDNPTDFVRNYVLDVRPIQVDRLRRSIELYQYLANKIRELKAQSAALGQVLRIINRTNDNERLIRFGEWEIARLRWEKFRREVRDINGRLKKLTAESESKRHAAVSAEAAVSRIEADLSRIDIAFNSSEPVQLSLRYEAERKAAVAERANAIGPLAAFSETAAKIAAGTTRGEPDCRRAQEAHK